MRMRDPAEPAQRSAPRQPATADVIGRIDTANVPLEESVAVETNLPIW